MHPRTVEVLEYLDRQRAGLRAAFEAVPAGFRECAPAEGRWSAAGVVEHLAIVEMRVAARLSARIAQARAEGAGPEMSMSPVLPASLIAQTQNRTARAAAPDAVQPTGLDSQSAWSALEAAGDAVRQAAEDGDNLALDGVFMAHPRFGEMPLYHFFAFIGAHEARHAEQILEVAEHAIKLGIAPPSH